MNNKIKQKFAQSVVANNLGEAISFFLGLLTLPIILGYLGVSQYGILILLTALVGWLSLVDFGTGAAVVKFIAQYQAENDVKKVKQAISSTWTFFLGTSLMAALIVYFSSGFLVGSVFKIATQLSETALAVFQLGALLVFFRFIANFFNILAHGYQRFDLFNAGKVVGLVGNSLGVVIGLMINNSIIVVVWIYIVSALTEGLTTYGLLWRAEGRIPLGLKFSLKTFKPIISFGGWKLIMALASQTTNQLDKLIISFYLPTQYVTYYSVPQSLSRRLSSTLSVVSEPLFPFASFINSSQPLKVLQKLYQKTIRSANLVMIPVALFIAVFAKEILTIWLGQEFAQNAHLVLTILSLGYMIIGLTTIPVKVTEAKGRPEITALFSLFSGIIRVGLAVFLTARFALLGLAGSLLLYAIPVVALFLWYINRFVIRLSSKDFLGHLFVSYFKPTLVSLLILIPFSFFMPTSLISLILVFAVYEATVLAEFYLLNLFSKEELIGFTNHFLGRSP